MHSYEAHTLGMMCYGITLGDLRDGSREKNVFVGDVIHTSHEGPVVPHEANCHQQVSQQLHHDITKYFSFPILEHMVE